MCIYIYIYTHICTYIEYIHYIEYILKVIFKETSAWLLLLITSNILSPFQQNRNVSYEHGVKVVSLKQATPTEWANSLDTDSP